MAGLLPGAQCTVLAGCLHSLFERAGRFACRAAASAAPTASISLAGLVPAAPGLQPHVCCCSPTAPDRTVNSLPPPSYHFLAA